MNTQEPPFSIPSNTIDQPLIQTLVDTSTKVDTTIRIDIVEQRQTKEQLGQIDASVPNAHEQGATQIIVTNKRRFEERKKPLKHW